MLSGKSKSQANPDGIRRKNKSGQELPPRSKRRLPVEILRTATKNKWHHGWKAGA